MIAHNAATPAPGARRWDGLGWLALGVILTLALALAAPGDLAPTLGAVVHEELWHLGSPLLPGLGHSLRLSAVVALGQVVLWAPLAVLATRQRQRQAVAQVLAACERLAIHQGGVLLLLVGVALLGRTGFFLGTQHTFFPFAAAHGVREEGFWALALIYLVALLPLAGLGLGAALRRAQRMGVEARVSAPALLVMALLVGGGATVAQLTACHPAECVVEHVPGLLVRAYQIGDVPLIPLFGHVLALLLAPTATAMLLLAGLLYTADERRKQAGVRILSQWALRVVQWLLRH